MEGTTRGPWGLALRNATSLREGKSLGRRLRWRDGSRTRRLREQMVLPRLTQLRVRVRWGCGRLGCRWDSSGAAEGEARAKRGRTECEVGTRTQNILGHPLKTWIGKGRWAVPGMGQVFRERTCLLFQQENPGNVQMSTGRG